MSQPIVKPPTSRGGGRITASLGLAFVFIHVLGMAGMAVVVSGRSQHQAEKAAASLMASALDRFVEDLARTGPFHPDRTRHQLQQFNAAEVWEGLRVVNQRGKIVCYGAFAYEKAEDLSQQELLLVRVEFKPVFFVLREVNCVWIPAEFSSLADFLHRKGVKT